MSQTRRLKLADLGRVLAEDLRTIQRRVVESTHSAAADGAVVARANAPEAFGDLKDGIYGGPLDGMQGARIRSTAPYSAAAEVGSRPHMPPVEPLIRWVKLRGMQGVHGGKAAPPAARFVKRVLRSRENVHVTFSERDGGTLSRGRTVRSLDIVEAERLAWQIALKIKREGTRPTWFMKRSVAPVFRLFQRHLTQRLNQPL